MLKEFLEIAKDARSAGGRIFSEMLDNREKYLKKRRLPIDEVLLSLTEEERKKFLPLLEYFTSTSFYFLFKKLEEGESMYSFELTMKNVQTGETYSLINDQVDHDIRTSLREP